jgi:leucyl-tRNA synthetase
MEWTDEGIAGRIRFLDRVWRVTESLAPHARSTSLGRLPEMRGDPQRELVRAVHAALKSGNDEAETRRFHFNTTLARLDELVNAMTKFAQTSGAHQDPALLYAAHVLPIALAPFAPHIAEELWQRYGHERSVHLERWPAADPKALSVDQIDIVVQVNGKLRGRIVATPGMGEKDVLALALADSKVAGYLHGKNVRKHIYVSDKLLSFVVD